MDKIRLKTTIAITAIFFLIQGINVLFPDLFLGKEPLYAIITVVLTIGILWAGFPIIFVRTYYAIKSKNFSVDVCLSLAVLLALINDVYLLCNDISLVVKEPFGYSIILIVVLILLDYFVWENILDKIDGVVGYNIISQNTPASQLKVALDGTTYEERISPYELHTNDSYNIKNGERVPCDSQVMSGLALVNERTLSGYGTLKIKRQGGTVFAGSDVLRGELKCQVISSTVDSVLPSYTNLLNTRLKALIEQKPKYVALQTRMGLMLMAASAVLFVIWLMNSKSLGIALDVAITTLMMAPILRVVEMLLLLKAIVFSNGFKHGYLFNKDEALENLRDIKNMIFNFNLSQKPGRPEVAQFELLDNRIDLKMLQEVVFGFVGTSDDARYAAVTRFLSSKVLHPMTRKIDNFQNYDNVGMSGKIEGADFSIGEEKFLLDRGVQLQQSDIYTPTENETVTYVAIQNEVVARIIIDGNFLVDGKELVSNLKKMGIRTVLISTETEGKLEDYKKKLELPSTDIHAGLTEKQVNETIENCKNASIYMQPGDSKELNKHVRAIIELFNTNTCEIVGGDVILFSKGLDLITNSFKLIKNYWNIYTVTIVASAAMSGVLFGLSAVSLSSPLWISIFSILTVLGLSRLIIAK